MRNLMCCPEAGSRPGTNVALPLWSPSWYRFTLPVMGVRSLLLCVYACQRASISEWLLPSLLYFPSSNQIRWAPIHNMQIDKHQQLQLQFSSPPRGAPSSTLPSPGCRRPSRRAIVSEFLNKSLESDFFLFTRRDAGTGATHGWVLVEDNMGG